MNSDGKGTFTHDTNQDIDPHRPTACAAQLASYCSPWADTATCAACATPLMEDEWSGLRQAGCTSNDVDTLCSAANAATSFTGYPKCGLADVNADGAPSFHVHDSPKSPKAAQICASAARVTRSHPVHACPARTLAHLARTHSHPTRSAVVARVRMPRAGKLDVLINGRLFERQPGACCTYAVSSTLPASTSFIFNRDGFGDFNGDGKVRRARLLPGHVCPRACIPPLR